MHSCEFDIEKKRASIVGWDLASGVSHLRCLRCLVIGGMTKKIGELTTSLALKKNGCSS